MIDPKQQAMAPAQQSMGAGQAAPAVQPGPGQMAPPEQPPAQPIAPDAQQTEQIEGALVNEGNVELGEPQEMQLEAYKDNATLVVFSESSQAAILQSLQAGENPMMSVALTANQIHKQLESSLAEKGEKMTEITLCLGAAHLVAELIVLADAAGLYSLSNEERLEAYKQSLRKYFEDGLKDGSIDPVELQKTMEPLLNEKQRAFGMQEMQKRGLSKTAPPSGTGRAQPQQPQQPQQQKRGILGGAQ